jgi:NADPH-dependent 2,4-dienoyl-CoA reductase/sulfur reductase-like enzyme
MQHDDATADAAITTDATIEIATVVDDELVGAFERLIPQLSSSSPPPSREVLSELVDGAATVLFIARVDGEIVGSLTLAFYRIPTGLKAWIATGGAPKHLPFGKGDVIYFRNFQHYKHLRELTENANHFAVIGGSFIGSEIAAALTLVGEKVTLVVRGEAICEHIFPSDLAHFLNDYYRQKGVEVLTGETVAGLQREDKTITMKTESGRVIKADVVVAGIGIHPNLDLAKESSLKIDNGIVVNERLETSVPDIYAAGDVANFFHSALEKRTRVEHENNAVEMGKTAGRNMANETEAYTHIPMFYSDLFDLGYEAVGEMNSKMEMIADWQEKLFKKGVIYYMDDGRVRGVLLWNVWKKVDDARALLKEKGPFKKKDLIGRIMG